MEPHKHSPAREDGPFGYSGTARGAANSPTGEDSMAHGGRLYIQICSCGASREVNRNGLCEELGTWQGENRC